MMKVLLALALVSVGLTGSAEAKNKRKPSSSKPLVCRQEGEDGVLVATFNPKKTEVSLFVPHGESSGKAFKGKCEQDKNAFELSLNCNVNTSTDSGYNVHLYSPGGAQLGATAAAWSMAGQQPAVNLNCGKDE